MILQCQHLTKRFGDKVVLRDVSLSLEEGKIVGLLGRNGQGKSTLLKLICDLLTPTEGTILVDGKPVGPETKAIISYLPERTHLDKNMTVHQVIRFFGDFYQDFDAEKAYRLLGDLDLDPAQRLSHMSKGMQEKVQLVLVMSRKARLYLLDEPLGGVDPATRDYILDTILTNFEEGATVVISTHLISDIERILDQVIFLDKGEIRLKEDTDTLRTRENASVDEIFRRTFKC